MGSLCCVIYFASITYHLKSNANQSLSITAIFVSSRNGKERCVRAQNGCIYAHALSRLFCCHERCLPTKELEKRCVTKQRTAAQTCVDRTNMPT